jgi:hypothetical protein
MGVGGAGIGGGRTGYWKWAHGVLEVGVHQPIDILIVVFHVFFRVSVL